VRERLRRAYSALEEAKAEIVSLLFSYYLVENGHLKLDAKEREQYLRRMATNYVASTFRTARFGVTSDHAKGKIFEFNRLRQSGAIRFTKGRYTIDARRFKSAVEKLAIEILDLQLRGDEAQALALLDREGAPSEELQAVLALIDKPAPDREPIPVDLRVRYVVPGASNYSVIAGERIGR
jgi:hypothetical protein